MTIFGLKMMVKIGLDFFYFEIERAPSEIPANPGQFSLSGLICCTGQQQLKKGSFNFKINKKSRPLFTIIFKPKMVFSRVKGLVHL
jgi:hypothetical protein